MKGILRRTLAIFLVLALAVGFAPWDAMPPVMRVNAYTGTGTEASPFTIGPGGNYVTWGNFVSAISANNSNNTLNLPTVHFRLIGDVRNEGSFMWEEFKANLDGNGFTVEVTKTTYRADNIHPDSEGNSWGGLFFKSSGNIRNINVHLNNLTIINNKKGNGFQFYVGGIVGHQNGGSITNSAVSGSLIAVIDNNGFTFSNGGDADAESFVGGVVGWLGGGGRITSCRVNGLTLHNNTGTSTSNTASGRTTYYYYRLYSGGIAGKIMGGGHINACLIEGNSNIEVGHSRMIRVRRSYAGGIFGQEWENNANHTVRDNVIRNTGIRVMAAHVSNEINGGAGYAGYIGGFSSSQFNNNVECNQIGANVTTTSRNGISNVTHFWAQGDRFNLDNPTSHAANNLGAGTNTNGQRIAWRNDTTRPWGLTNSNKDKFLDTFINANGGTISVGSTSLVPIWMVTEAPTLAANPTISGRTVSLTLNAPYMPQTDKRTTNPRLHAGSGIQYEIKVTGLERLAAPENPRIIDGKLVLDAPSDVTVRYSTDDGGTYAEYPTGGILITADNENAAFLVKASRTNATDSNPRTVTITRGDGIALTIDTATKDDGAPAEARVLATPAAKWDNDTAPAAIVLEHAEDTNVTIQWKKENDGTYADYTGAIPIPLTAAGTHVYSAKAVHDNDEATESSEITVTVEVICGLDHCDDDDCGDGVDPCGNHHCDEPADDCELKVVVPDDFPVTGENNGTPAVPAKLATPVVEFTQAAAGAGHDGIVELSYPTTSTLPDGVNVTFLGGTTSPPTAAGSSVNIENLQVGENVFFAQSTTTHSDYNDSGILKFALTKTTGTGAYIAVNGGGTDLERYVPNTVVMNNSNRFSTHNPTGSELRLSHTFDFDVAGIEIRTWYNTAHALSATYHHSAANITPAPTITSPSVGDLSQGGITITAANATDTIYWRMGFSGDPQPPVTTGGGVFGSHTISWNDIGNEFKEASMWVTAVAHRAGTGMQNSAVTTQIYGAENKPVDTGPRFTINNPADNSEISSNIFYNVNRGAKDDDDEDILGDEVIFTLPGTLSATGAGTIYYTIGENAMPTRTGSGMSGTPINAGGTLELLESHMTPGKNEIRINAVYVRDHYPDTAISTQIINVKDKHQAPRFSIANNSGVPRGKGLVIHMDPRDIPQEIRPQFYMLPGDNRTYTWREVTQTPGDYYGVLEVWDNPGFNYDSYALALPTVMYKITGNEDEATYIPGVPEIRLHSTEDNDDGERVVTTVTEPHRRSEITLSGTAGARITVSAQLLAKNTDAFIHSDNAGPVTYIVYEAAAAPTAMPDTNAQSQSVVELGSIVQLFSETPGAQIYWSTDGFPQFERDSTGFFRPVNDGGPDSIRTNVYSAIDAIRVSGTAGGFFTVYAVAVRNDMSESGFVSFTYRIAELPVAAAPTATPRTEDGSPRTMQSGDVITLHSNTSGAKIYYSLTGTPSVAGGVPGAGTLLFDQSITVSGNAGEFFRIRAVAAGEGLTNSEVVTFIYQLPAPVQAVFATPGAGTVISGTDVSLGTTTAGADIFFEIAEWERDLKEPTPNESQMYSKPFTIEEDTWIRAVAVKDGVSSIVTTYEYKVAEQVATPVPSIPSGSVVARGTMLTLKSETEGANITYTLDGSDPAKPSAADKEDKRMYGSEIAISADEGTSVSISAFAQKAGMTPSEVISVSYTVSRTDEVITANPPSDTVVRPGDQITLSTAITGADIYTTTDGSEPSRQSRKGSTVLVDGAYGEVFLIRAVAATETTVTAPQVFTYRVIERTPAPSAGIPSGAIFLDGARVVLSAPEGMIYYTTDGSDPTSNSRMYSEPIPLTSSMVLKAIAVAEGKAASTISQYIYTMAGQVEAPSASLQSGMIDVGSRIALSTSTEGATIYYTTNGSDPNIDNLRDSFVYEGPITISRPVSIRMFAVKTGMNPSVINTVTYTVAFPPEPEEEEEESAFAVWNTDRLFLFDQFADSGEGPLFDWTVLRDGQTLVVISAAEGALPEGAQLNAIRERSPSVEDEEAVARSSEMNSQMRLASLYHITITDSSGNLIQPLRPSSVEIGVPIPEGYDDTVLLICRINPNGTVTAFPTRRSAGMAYAVVDHFSKYAVAVPYMPQDSAFGVQTWHMILLGAVAAVLAGTALVVIIKKKRGRHAKALNNR